MPTSDADDKLTPAPTYRVFPPSRPQDRTYILCLVCGRESSDLDDIQNRYCGHCHEFHNALTIELSKGERTLNPVAVARVRQAMLKEAMRDRPPAHNAPAYTREECVTRTDPDFVGHMRLVCFGVAECIAEGEWDGDPMVNDLLDIMGFLKRPEKLHQSLVPDKPAVYPLALGVMVEPGQGVPRKGDIITALTEAGLTDIQVLMPMTAVLGVSGPETPGAPGANGSSISIFANAPQGTEYNQLARVHEIVRKLIEQAT